MKFKHNYKYYPQQDEHEWKVEIEGFKYDVWIVMYPLLNEKGYYTIGIINMFGHQRRYGFSDHENTSKYVLKLMLEDITDYINGIFPKSPYRT